MRAVVLTGTGGPDVLRVEERPDPPVGPGEVRIAVKAAGINFADTLARVGLYPDAPATPCVLGYEVAGEIESVGGGAGSHAVGDRVMAPTRFGGQAELVVVPEDQALPLPETISFEQGAAFPVNYGTAHAALVIMGSLREGDRVLVQGAGGGVGIAATQICRNVGAEVFGTASPAKHEAIRAQGVIHAIDYRGLDFEQEVMRLTNGEGVDLVIDASGPDELPQGLSAASPGRAPGHVRDLRDEQRRPTRPAGHSAGAGEDAGRHLALVEESDGDEREQGSVRPQPAQVVGPGGRFRRVTEPLMSDLEAGRLEPVVAASFPFEQAGDAQRMIGERRNVGKVVLFP